MDVDAFLRELRADPAYAGQIVHVHEVPARRADWAPVNHPALARVQPLLERLEIARLYRHQADAVQAALEGRDVWLATGTASGKSLGYILPILERLRADPAARVLLLFPTKALCQDQYTHFAAALARAGLADRLAGVLDGDTPAALRRRLRDGAACIFSNPDMLHAAILPQHGRWAGFFGGLRLVVLDELHAYSGIFGTNMALLLERLRRVCAHYGTRPLYIAASATIANPKALADRLTGRDGVLIAADGSPRGRRVYVFWNPPRRRATDWRSRRSANVEAHELLVRLLRRGAPTIVFSKARVTAEMIYRYARESLLVEAPELADRITPYRGGYRPEDRRAIERRLFGGELLGVSTTPALELGIDVGGLEASVIVGYPGTRASFFQQAGRAGRRAGDALVVLIGLDTAVNQYVMSRPDYLFARSVEEAVLDPGNPFVACGQLRCAAHELPLTQGELAAYGPWAATALEVLAGQGKVRCVDGRWHHASAEVPQHEVPLRASVGANVLIQEQDGGEVIGEVDRFDASPLVHPHAVYLHHGDTYIVESLDLERNLAVVRREEVDYYTQPHGGEDVHHIDQQLRSRPFGRGRAAWGEVTVYGRTYAYEKIRFYELDEVSVHPLKLPTLALETQALWIVPDEALLEAVRRDGLDAHSGLRGIGYATRMLLPLFMTCDTLDFSHTVGAVNAPWQAVFIYERFPLGLGFTAKAYERLGEILPAVREAIRACPCEAGCPCCVGKPLRGFTTWNVERGESSIPSKAAALRILEGLLGDDTALAQPDDGRLVDGDEARRLAVAQTLRRRLERQREPLVMHAIRPAPAVETACPAPEVPAALAVADVARRAQRRGAAARDLQKRLAKKLDLDGLPPSAPKPAPPPGMSLPGGSNLRPTAFPGRPAPAAAPPRPLVAGDCLAARARKRLAEQRGKTQDAGE